MSILQSFSGGIGRVKRFPSLLFCLYLVMLALAVPLALAMRALLQDAIGGSLVSDNLRKGFDLGWFGEFSARSSGLGETFSPSVIGILPMLSNLEKLLEGDIYNASWTILLAGFLFLLVWAFFGGGILDRYACPEEPHSRSRLLSKGGEYFFCFVRLLLLSLFLYWAIFRWVAEPLHQLVEEFTRDVTAERTIMLYTLSVYALAGLLLMITNMSLDYAKIAIVVEKRRSSILAFIRGLQLVFTHPIRTMGLYLLLCGVGLLMLAIYSLVAPGPGQATWATLLIAFLAGQAYLIARLVLKLWFMASQTVLFQLAHQREQHTIEGVSS